MESSAEPAKSISVPSSPHRLLRVSRPLNEYPPYKITRKYGAHLGDVRYAPDTNTVPAIRCGIAALLRIGRRAFTCDSRFVGPAEMLQFPFSLRAMRSTSSRPGLEVTSEGRLMQGKPMRAVADRVIGFGLRSHPATSKRFRHDQTAMRRRAPSDGRDCRRLAAIRARPQCFAALRPQAE